MICGRLTNGLVISPIRKSSTRVAQGMIHEMEPRVPLLHATPKKVWTARSPCQRMQHSGTSYQRWRRDAVQPQEVPQPHYAMDTCFSFLKVVFDVHRGNQRSCWVPPPPRRPPENRSTAASNDSLTKMTSFVSRRHMGKMGFCKPFKSCKHNFGCLVPSCRTTPTLAGLGCSSARTYYLAERRSHMRSPTRAVITLSQCNQAKVYL